MTVRPVVVDGFTYSTLAPVRPPRRTRAGYYTALANQAAAEKGNR